MAAPTNTTTDALLLYDHPVSSYAQKIRIALREKGIPFESRHLTSPGFDADAFRAANPRAEVPTLVDGGFAVFDSTIILEYIEDKWPEPPLLPQGARERAEARTVEEVCDTQYEAINWGWGEVAWMDRATGDLRDHLEAQCRAQVAAVQDWLERRLGGADWFNGATFGWADLCVAPIVNRSAHFGFGPAAGGALERWLRRVARRPSVAETFAEFEAAAGKMSGLKELVAAGKMKREYRDHRLEWMVKSGGIEVVREGLRRDNIRFSWPEGQQQQQQQQ